MQRVEGLPTGLIPKGVYAQVQAAADKIKSGELVVHDYMADNACPAASF